MNRSNIGPADNAPKDNGCSITQEAVRPTQLGNSDEFGGYPIIFEKIEDDLNEKAKDLDGGGKSASTAHKLSEIMKSRGKSAVIAEDKNEIIEIPMRGHGKKLTSRNRAKTEDPRPGNSAKEIIEDIAGERQRRTAGKILRQPGEKRKYLLFLANMCKSWHTGKVHWCH